jgi:hypothetical protein
VRRALQELVRNVDRECTRAEQNNELSASAIRPRRAELCDHALGKLVNFRAFEIAEKALTENVGSLERRANLDTAQVQMHDKLRQALQDIREGVEATRRMLLDRCKRRQGVFV